MPTEQLEPVAPANPNMDVESIWHELSVGIRDVYLRREMTTQRFMQLYTHVYNYCTRTGTADPNAAPAGATRGNRGGRSSRRPPAQSMTAPPSETASYNGSGYVGHDLYTRIRGFMQQYLEELSTTVNEKIGDDLLTCYQTEWEHYTFSSKVVNGFCQYLNRHWVRRECDEGKNHVYQIYQLCLDIWKSTIFQTIHQRLTNTLLSLIEKDRLGGTINTSLVSVAISSYVELGVDEEATPPSSIQSGSPQYALLQLGIYKNKFENPFIRQTENFYAAESMEYLTNNPIVDYMRKAQTRIAEEQARTDLYLHASTLENLMKTCDTVLIRNHLDLLHSEFPRLLQSENGRLENLGRIYGLISRLENCLDLMKESLQAHITGDGTSAIAALGDTANDPKCYVTTILEVYQKHLEVVNVAFKSDPGFKAALDKACGIFINNNQVTQLARSAQKSPEMVARYCDLLLKKTGRNTDDRDLEESLNQAMIVFRFLEDKDVFQKFYSKLLASRLVAGMSASDDAESSMIGKLKLACGFEYTSKLQRMYQDVNVSKDMNEEFRQWCTSDREGAECLPLDFYVHVLQSGSWPFAQSFEFNLPNECEPCVRVFNNYYNFKHNGRKLSWLYNRSKGEMSTSGYAVRHIFLVSTYQMGILLMFNKNDSLLVSEVSEATLLKGDLLKQILQILVKVGVLSASVSDENIQEDTKISYVKDYRNKKIRVNLNVPLRFEQRIDAEQTHAAVDGDREFNIQAAIVRIMKMRKEMNHQTLIGEVCNQLTNRFKPNVPSIKKCIDMLIEKEYLERKEGELNTYLYRA